MRARNILMALFAAAACLLSAGCAANNEEEITGDFASLASLVASDAADSDFLGWSVAIDGDIAVVGAPGADVNGTDDGAAYVYYRNQGGTNAWGQVAKLVPGDGASSDYFGCAVAISGDIIAVGAYGEDGSGADMGAAYVFYRNQGGSDAWGMVRKIAASDGEADDMFGGTLTLDGDTLVVGTPYEAGGGSNRGAAYVYYQNQGGDDNWGELVKLTAPDSVDDEGFGFDVGLDGDTLIVGVPFRAGTGTEQGSACVYSRDQGGTDAWGLVKEITPGDPSDSSCFGYSVAVHGGVAIAGSPQDSDAGSYAGAAYLFYRDQGGTNAWGQVKKFKAGDASASAFAGWDVAMGDGYAIVGASSAAGGGSQRGQAYILARDDGGADNWGQLQRLRAGGSNDKAHFGYSVDISGLDVLVSAPGVAGSGINHGAAFIFEKTSP
ncbi:MAG: FG-GAP repeat protein [Acidobacteriota bacterium]